MKILSTSSITRLILGVLILMLLGWHAAELRKSTDQGKLSLNDFEEYWAACRIFLDGGNPYDSSQVLKVQRSLGSTDPRPLMMWNPPWTLPLLLPFCSLPFWTGWDLWFLFNLALVFLSANWLWIQFGGPPSRRWLSWLAAMFFLPVGSSLALGQVSTLVLVGVVMFIRALQKKRDFCAGAAAIAIATKPHLLYLFWLFVIVWILRQKRWCVLSGVIASLLLCSVIVLIINPPTFLNYYRALSSPNGLDAWETPTWGMALLMLFPRAGAWIRYLPSLFGVIIAIVLWISWRHEFDWERRFPVISLLSVTTSSFTWTFDWIVLFPVVILMLLWFQSSPVRLWWLPAGLAIMQPLLYLSPVITRTNFGAIWVPPVLWLLFWAGSRALDRLQPGRQPMSHIGSECGKA